MQLPKQATQLKRCTHRNAKSFCSHSGKSRETQSFPSKYIHFISSKSLITFKCFKGQSCCSSNENKHSHSEMQMSMH